MKYSYFNILSCFLYTFTSFFIFYVSPVLLHAEEQNPESAELVPHAINSINIEKLTEEKGSEPVERITQETSLIAALFQGQMTKHPENGRQKQYYFIKRPSLGGQLTYELEKDSQTHNGTTYTDTSHRFKETIRIQTAGWVYNPALMKYSLMFEPELNQTKEELSQGEAADSSSFSPDYSMTATFLEAKPYTLNIFGIRQQTSNWASFSGNSESTVDSYGANGQLKYKILPTTFGYSHSENDQAGFYTSHDIHDAYNLSSTHQARRSNTNLTSTYSDDKRDTENIKNQIKTFNNNLFNNYQITEDNKVTLDSSMSYNTQESDWIDSQNINIREHLGWRHRPNLQSNYSASHSRQESGDFSSNMTTLDAGLTHLLYENLTTNVGSRASQSIYSDEKETAGAGLLNFSYIRPFSWTTLGLHSGWDYLYTERSGLNAAESLVSNEMHSMSYSNEVYLNNYNIDINSIIVTNTFGTLVYIENIDYTVEMTNSYVRMRRLPFGSITEGQTVSVNYRYLRDSAYNDALFTENYGFNFDLWHDWRFSYNFIRVTQDIISGQTPQNLVDDTIHKTDIRYDIGWSNTSLSYEDNNRLSSASYTRSQMQETLHWSLSQIYFSMSGYLGQTDYKDHDETNNYYGGVTIFDWMLRRWCKLHLEGYYDKTMGDFDETENNGLKAGLEFRYRIWTARLSYELTDQNYINTDSQRKEQLVRMEFIRAMW